MSKIRSVVRSGRAPFLITMGVVVALWCLQALPSLFPRSDHVGESRFDLIQRMEWMTYDWRMRMVSSRPARVATNLGAVFIDDEGLAKINRATGFYWPWPRQLFGRVLRELKAQGARVVACDVFFLERQRDFAETRVPSGDGAMLGSDAFFGWQLRQSGNVLLGCPGERVGGQLRVLPPADLFRTNALALGYAGTDRDADGVLRRARAYVDDPVWGRVWHLGLRLAAEALGLDLDATRVEPRQLILTGPSGVQRTIPLDAQGLFLIDWTLSWYDRRVAYATFEELLEFDEYRQAGETNLEALFSGRIAVIGSLGSGSNLSDVGATPIEKETYLVSKHWNVANSLLMDRFIRPTPWWGQSGLIGLMALVAAVLTWRLRVLWASFFVLVLLAGYTLACVWAFDRFRWWIPLVLPLGGALMVTHVSLVTWRLVFEQHERRRVRAIFSRIVAPEVVNELLGQERLRFGGSWRCVTILFADVRGFTRLTDEHQRAAEAYVQAQGLTGRAAEAHFEQSARATLETVNAYLAVIADQIKLHHGTLDKYIGDCVMAFWGAPVANERHAVAACRAAVESQRALHALNQQREEQNLELARGNERRRAEGLPERPLLGLLSLGTGIHTGTATIGLMGSDAHILNYTAFGREVNLASRLEGVSGHGRIVISGATYRELVRLEPALAARCLALEPVAVKGFSAYVPVYELAWQCSAQSEDKRGSEGRS